jgi:DNA repair exonuclease SbcCD ATPase subunit
MFVKHNILKAVIILFFISFSACKNDALEEANDANDSLQTLLNMRDSSINEFMAAFNSVENNLDEVSAKQHLISVNTDKAGDLKFNRKARIVDEINAINALMEENKKVIEELQNSLKNASTQSIEYQKQLQNTIDVLNKQVELKNAELEILHTKLSTLNVSVSKLEKIVDTLLFDNKSKTKKIAELSDALHTAYYVIGDNKELIAAKIIDKQGGILGLGRTTKLSENFDHSKFSKIDYTKAYTLSINSPKVKIITNHPSDSYSLQQDIRHNGAIRNLKIIDPEKFWSVSKYLVVEREN